MKQLLNAGIVLLFAVVTASCQPVKPYQRIYLNDSAMKNGNQGAGLSEENIQAYREGAMGGGSSKTSGGCGCN